MLNPPAVASQQTTGTPSTQTLRFQTMKARYVLMHEGDEYLAEEWHRLNFADQNRIGEEHFEEIDGHLDEVQGLW